MASALVQLSGLHACRRAAGGTRVRLAHNLRLAARQWARQRRLAATVIFTLALGIGGATTMYAVLQAISRLGQPTVPRADEVGRLFTGLPYESDPRGSATLEDCRRFERARSIETLAAYAAAGRLLGAAGDEEIEVVAATPGFFRLLRVPPVIGRFFTPEEARAGDGRLALVGERAWRTRFGADPGILGRTLDLDGEPYTVIGVAAERLGLVMPATEMIVPLVDTDGRTAVRVFVRRRAVASWDELRAEVKAIGLAEPGTERQVRVVPVLEDAGYRTRISWMTMVAPAVLVLLIGCGNVASLLLVRAMQREREIATRMALGASRAQLAAQLLVEGWVLAVTGGAIGVALAAAGLRGAQALVPASLDVQFRVDAKVLSFVGLATLLTPLFFGITPLMHSLRTNLTDALRAGLRRPLFGSGQYHLRDVFAILEVGVATGLVLFTSMLLSFLAATRSLTLGFQGEGLIVAELSVPDRGPQKDGRSLPADLTRRLAQQVAAIPGVVRATVGALPFYGDRVGVSRPDGSQIPAGAVEVGDAYFETLRLPIVRGRAIEERDVAGALPVAVVSEALAARLWPGEDPVGGALRVARDGRTETITVVGVSKDAVVLGGLQQVESRRLDLLRWALYQPPARDRARGVAGLVVRVPGRPGSWYTLLRAAILAVDPRLRVRRVTALGRTFDLMGREEAARGMPWLALQLAFCALALLLAAVGVFGVMRQLVDERRAEFGVRLALGAPARSLVASVVGDGLIRIGVGTGMAIAFVAVVARRSFVGLVSVSAADLRTWLAFVAVVALAGAAACYLPARRAARVDPVEVLRCE
jgi:putative ABC transport system permease protein